MFDKYDDWLSLIFVYYFKESTTHLRVFIFIFYWLGLKNRVGKVKFYLAKVKF